MADATCTPDLLRFDLLEVAIDDTLKRKLILALLFIDTLVVHPTYSISYEIHSILAAWASQILTSCAGYGIGLMMACHPSKKRLLLPVAVKCGTQERDSFLFSLTLRQRVRRIWPPKA